MKNREKVSIIIPCYNYSHFLHQTIYSIELQKVHNLDVETIIVDDGSTDNTESIIKNSYPNIRYIHQSHQGPAAARNTGIQAATGDYFLFLDADDCIADNVLQSQVDNIKECKNCDISVCQPIMFTPEDARSYRISVRPLYKDLFNIHVFHTNIAPLSAFMLKKRVVQCCIFNTSDVFLEDYAFIIKCLMNDFSINTNISCNIFYRKHNSEMSKCAKKYKFNMRIYTLLDEFFNNIQKNSTPVSVCSSLALHSILMKKVSLLSEQEQINELFNYMQKYFEYIKSSYISLYTCNNNLQSLFRYYIFLLWKYCIRARNLPTSFIIDNKQFIVNNFNYVLSLSEIEIEAILKKHFADLTYSSADISPAINSSIVTLENILNI